MGNKPKSAACAVRSALKASIAVLAVACVPAYAASSGIICDQSSRSSESPAALDMQLNVEVVDLGNNGTVITRRPDLLGEDPLLPTAVSPQRFETSSRVTELLRRIFEEAAAEQFPLDEDRNPVRGTARESAGTESGPDRPAAELNVPDRLSDDGREEVQQAPETATEFPGISEEEYSRYRRQMYRKDI